MKELHYNVTGQDRKELVGIISKVVGMKAVYKFMPTCAFVINNITVEKDGTMVWDERTDQDTIEAVIIALAAAGFNPVKDKAETEETGLTIEIPLEKVSVGNLTKLLDAKGELIKKALGVEDIRIELKEDRIAFPWFKELPSPEEIKAYSHFIAALCEMALNQKRITAKEKPVDNDKYAFRCFLLRLGFIGEDYKAERKILLRNLSGSSAFKSGAKKTEVGIMRVISKAALEGLRRRYKPGTRVELLQMDDVQAPPIGTKGTVLGVDDIGSIMVAWDNGSGLSVAYGADLCRVVSGDE